jgi:hypothetical protein
MFFNPKHRKKLQMISNAMGIIVVLSMILFSVSALLR